MRRGRPLRKWPRSPGLGVIGQSPGDEMQCVEALRGIVGGTSMARCADTEHAVWVVAVVQLPRDLPHRMPCPACVLVIHTYCSLQRHLDLQLDSPGLCRVPRPAQMGRGRLCTAGLRPVFSSL